MGVDANPNVATAGFPLNESSDRVLLLCECVGVRDSEPEWKTLVVVVVVVDPALALGVGTSICTRRCRRKCTVRQ